MKEFHGSFEPARKETKKRSGKRYQIEPCLCLFGQAGKEHGYKITRVPVSDATHDDTVALDPCGIPLGMQHDGHFSPRRYGRIRAELDAAFSYANIFWRES
jgi:hypothetical protein